MFFSNTNWPQLVVPFYSIFLKPPFAKMEQEFSPIMPDEVRVVMESSDHLTDLDI